MVKIETGTVYRCKLGGLAKLSLSKLSLFLSLPLCRRSSLLMRRGKGWERNQIIWPGESLALCKSFNILCSTPCTHCSPCGYADLEPLTRYSLRFLLRWRYFTTISTVASPNTTTETIWKLVRTKNQETLPLNWTPEVRYTPRCYLSRWGPPRQRIHT